MTTRRVLTSTLDYDEETGYRWHLSEPGRPGLASDDYALPGQAWGLLADECDELIREAEGKEAC